MVDMGNAAEIGQEAVGTAEENDGVGGGNPHVEVGGFVRNRELSGVFHRQTLHVQTRLVVAYEWRIWLSFLFAGQISCNWCVHAVRYGDMRSNHHPKREAKNDALVIFSVREAMCFLAQSTEFYFC